jgi:Phage integrase, N-terminal SAM-like domain
MPSLLRTRLIQDLGIRNYSKRTVEIYVRWVAEFAQYFRRSPEQLGEGHIREYQRLRAVAERENTTTVFLRSENCDFDGIQCPQRGILSDAGSCHGGSDVPPISGCE